MTHSSQVFFPLFFSLPPPPPFLPLFGPPAVGGLPRVCCVSSRAVRACQSDINLLGPEGWEAEQGGETEAVVSVQWAADWRADLT